MTTAAVEEYEAILSVGDTTFLDYRGIKVKREGYGPTGNGGNGLILHSALAIEPEQGQTIGLLWQKLWNREHKAKPPQNETPEQKKQRQQIARKVARQTPFDQKESYRWVEALTELEQQVENSTRVIHVFDREGDITEVFDTVRQLKHTGVLVRASHNRSLDHNSQRLWDFMTAQPVRFEQDIDLPATAHRPARKTKVEEYHKIFKSGCQSERYRLAAVGMKTLLGFLSVIAVELLHVTYLHRTQPDAPAVEILNSVQMEVLTAQRSKKLPSTLTVAWAVESVAALGGYLEHRRNTPIGIQVLWRGWLQLQALCQGWQLARRT
jgi:hypothetical protein